MIPGVRKDAPPLTMSPEERAGFLDNLVRRCGRFLEEEAAIAVTEVTHNPHAVDKLDLESITSILTIEDFHRMITAFSFQRSLLEAVFSVYSAGLAVEPEEYTALLEETAGDMINIVVGNSLGDFQRRGHAFGLSTPIIINEAKSILRYKKSELVTARIRTGAGDMLVLCISPGSFYDKKLDIEVSE